MCIVERQEKKALRFRNAFQPFNEEYLALYKYICKYLCIFVYAKTIKIL